MFAVGIGRVSGGFCALLAGAGAAVAIAACGPQATVSVEHHVRVALLEYRIAPRHIISAAGRLEIAVDNDGRLPHDLAILAPAPVTTTTGTLTETRTVTARTPVLAPGQRTTLTVALAPGHYAIASTVGADASLGSDGTLTVR